MIVRMTREQVNILIEETKKRYPTEACGVLFGDVTSEESVLRKIVPLQNVLESPTLFRIDPEEFLTVLSEAERHGMEHIGFFHSHPAPPNPSAADAKNMRLWPDNVWLIISSIKYGMAAYQSIDNGVKRIHMIIS